VETMTNFIFQKIQGISWLADKMLDLHSGGLWYMALVSSSIRHLKAI
jgi:hypothetical protein